jgi:hypothetical protein
MGKNLRFSGSQRFFAQENPKDRGAARPQLYRKSGGSFERNPHFFRASQSSEYEGDDEREDEAHKNVDNYFSNFVMSA